MLRTIFDYEENMHFLNSDKKNISSVQKHTNILLFADDATTNTNIHSVSEALELQSDLDVFCDW